MNFYSDNIINSILETEEDENIIPVIASFYEHIFTLFCKYSNKIVSPKYIMNLLADKTNSVAFRCMDTEFNIENCPSILIYRKYHDIEKNEIIYYILMICTKRNFKNLGYASRLLDDFIEHVKEKHKNSREIYKNIKLVLSSLESAVTFYESYGFKWTRSSLNQHQELMKYEKYEDDKEYFILELNV
jgi:ribosomal protein S18 acetylase RimI-like enzyme